MRLRKLTEKATTEELRNNIVDLVEVINRSRVIIKEGKGGPAVERLILLAQQELEKELDILEARE